MWQDLSYRSARATAISQATFYAQELMEEIKSKRFDENNDSPWSSTLGIEGETYPNYDDVDDFNGYSDNPATGYTRSVTVNYVRLDANNTWQNCAGSISCQSDIGDCTDCNHHCCYKRIDVSVSHRFADSSLVTIVSAY
jgi:hypothetical protein